MNKIFLPIDYLDVFLNKAHWSYYKYENYLVLMKRMKAWPTKTIN